MRCLGFIRLQRYLSRCGLGSRRGCEELITQGRVSVDGEVVDELGSAIDEDSRVLLDGRKVTVLPHRYFMLNKPKGIICVRDDPRGRRWVVEMIPKEFRPGMFPVGRLDIDTTGLILITNDGDLSNRIAHPRYGVEKEYVALVKGNMTEGELKAMEEGVMLDTGMVKGIRIISFEHVEDRTSVTLRIHEGRYHVVKRIFLAVGSRVYELHRRGIGDLNVDDLDIGGWREIGKDLILSKCGIE